MNVVYAVRHSPNAPLWNLRKPRRQCNPLCKEAAGLSYYLDVVGHSCNGWTRRTIKNVPGPDEFVRVGHQPGHPGMILIHQPGRQRPEFDDIQDSNNAESVVGHLISPAERKANPVEEIVEQVAS